MRTKNRLSLWPVVAMIGLILVNAACNGSSVVDKPVIGTGNDYQKVLTEASRLSDTAFKKMAADEELTDEDKESLAAAANQWQALVDYEPTKFAPYLALGMIYRGIGNLDKAEQNLRQCLTNVPSSTDPGIKETEAEAHFQLSKVLFDQKKYDEALGEADKAVRSFNGNANYFVARASVYTELRQKDAAIKDLNTALKLDPEHRRAKGLLKLLK